jgi:diamine N-acetyltransferase
MSDEVQLVPVSGAAPVAEVARMAYEVWNEHYVPLIGQAQVDYMIAKFQTTEAIHSQLASGYEYFHLQKAAELVGYAAIRHDAADARLFISKLYVLSAWRNAGVGRRTLGLLEVMARERGATHLWLTVNKGNPSVKAYERLGFDIVDAVVVDIGDGYVMDDYEMEKRVG